MRFVTFQSVGSDQAPPKPGILLPSGDILDLVAAAEAALSSDLIAADTVVPGSVVAVIQGGADALALCETLAALAADGKLPGCAAPTNATILAPIPRPLKNVFCVGRNYRAHITEGAVAQGIKDEAPEYPVFFSKPPTAVVGPDAAIHINADVSEMVDYEVELGVVIGKVGCNIAAADAIDHVFGFTIINDISARDVQRRHGGQYLKGKGMDTFCPLGPCIVTIDELPHFEDLRIALSVNGETRQDGNTAQMMFKVPELIASLSTGTTLEPGDLLATGTPSGVGYAMAQPQFLKEGDEIVCSIEGIGELRNSVRDVTSARKGTAAATAAE